MDILIYNTIFKLKLFNFFYLFFKDSFLFICYINKKNEKFFEYKIITLYNNNYESL